MKTASVVVVGAGIVGASVAYHLATRGMRNVVVFDRTSGPGGGSTGRSTGGFRAQFSSALDVRLSLLSRAKLKTFRDEVGTDPGYQPVGYLWLANSAVEMKALRAARLVQLKEGLTEVVEITPTEIAQLNPAVRLEGLVGGAFCHTDGFIHPQQMLEGYLSAAQKLGVRVNWNSDVTALERGEDGHITRVEAGGETIATGAVVNAAGPWASSLAALAEVDLPVVPLRRQVAITKPFDLLPPDMPMTVFVVDGFHLRVRDGRVLMLMPTPGVLGTPFATSVDRDWIASVIAKAHRRLPVMQRAEIDTEACWAGLYEMSPDRHAILGPAPGCPNLFLVNGSSGHGVMHAPALGQLAAEIIADGKASSLDVSGLRPSRFAEGVLQTVSELL